MRENLPKEMDFTHEARNGQRAADEFDNFRTSLYIREFCRLRWYTYVQA